MIIIKATLRECTSGKLLDYSLLCWALPLCKTVSRTATIGSVHLLCPRCKTLIKYHAAQLKSQHITCTGLKNNHHHKSLFTNEAYRQKPKYNRVHKSAFLEGE